MQTTPPEYRAPTPPRRSNTALLIAGIAAIVVLICCIGVAGIGFGAFSFLRTQEPAISTVVAQITPIIAETPILAPTPEGGETVPAVTPTGAEQATPATASSPTSPAGTPSAVAQQPSSDAEFTLKALENAVIPVRNPVELTQQLRLKNDAPIKMIVNDTTPHYKVGDTAEFWVSDNENNTRFKTKAVLRYIGEHIYMWVDENYNFSESALKKSADFFDTKAYPTDRKYFGTEQQPGIDNDPRLTVFIGNVPGVGGYFSASDSYPKAINPTSNERKMFFINAESSAPGTSYFDTTLAHEFQHMIHFNMNPSANTWVDEGTSVLAEFLNGFGNYASSDGRAYLNRPDTQLTHWNGDFPDPIHYGAAYLFIDYFAQRFGGFEILKDVYSKKDGKDIDMFNDYLKRKGINTTFDNVFRDWTVANLVNDKSINNGIYSYSNMQNKVTVMPTIGAGTTITTVHQYAADYFNVDPKAGEATVKFTGPATVKLLPFDQPPSGKYFWFSNRGDRSEMQLTHEFDLSSVNKATLKYSTWYQIEYGWDYCYVEVSTNGGKTWDVLKAPHSTDYDPQGNSFGWGYSGPDKNQKAAWVDEQIDLSKYAGKKVLVRFQYITDEAYNADGFALDNISVPEINFKDDVENGDNGWQAQGFVHVTNALPEHFFVQVVKYGAQTQVEQMQLDANNSGQLKLTGLGKDVRKVVIIVSAVAPTTIQPVEYKLTIQ